MSIPFLNQRQYPYRGRRFSYPKLNLTDAETARVSWALLALIPLLSFTLVEFLSGSNPWGVLSPVQIVLNLAWYYLGEALFFLLFRRRTAAVKWGLGISWGFGCASHYLISFRGYTLFPGDFFSLGTAANVAGHYNYMPDAAQIATLALVLVFFFLISMLPQEKKQRVSWKWLAPMAAVCAVYLAVFFGTGFVEFLGIKPATWAGQGNGLALNFSVCLKYLRVQPPEGSTQERLEQLARDYPAEFPAEEGEIQPVNVIAIMNEAFSDLTVLPGVESSQDAMPFLRSLTENTVKGSAYVSVFGGTTANSEYEFLTGNTTAFLPASTVPYQTYVSDGDPTLVAQMKALGYRCVASHPYLASGWNRPVVYEAFGFDEVYFEPAFQNLEYMRGEAGTGYISDQCDFENLIRMYEEKEAGERLFLFNVTMQNHSSYTMPWTNLSREVWLTGPMEGDFPAVDQYFSLIYQSDRAFEYLVDYFSKVEEPTIILMFGDHQPQVSAGFYAGILGSSPTIAAAERRQMVPFVLWANYSIPEREGVELSLNYLSTLLAETANLPKTGYQSFLSELYQTMPVINTIGVRSNEGSWYGANEALPEDLDEKLTDYQILLYNNIFDKENRPEGFFTLAEP